MIPDAILAKAEEFAQLERGTIRGAKDATTDIRFRFGDWLAETFPYQSTALRELGAEIDYKVDTLRSYRLVSRRYPTEGDRRPREVGSLIVPWSVYNELAPKPDRVARLRKLAVEAHGRGERAISEAEARQAAGKKPVLKVLPVDKVSAILIAIRGLDEGSQAFILRELLGDVGRALRERTAVTGEVVNR